MPFPFCQPGRLDAPSAFQNATEKTHAAEME
jgi:hypothetical protein